MDVLQQEAERRSRTFYSIGLFIFSFSQLEFTIRAILAGALGLNKEQFDTVTAPYDFNTLCNVTCNVLIQKNCQKADFFKDFFNECRELNNERVRVVHGLWTDNGSTLAARHVARNSLKANTHYEDPAELERYITKADKLMQQTLHLGPAIG